MGGDDPQAARTFPYLVAGMAPLHKPGHGPGANAVLALASIARRSHPAGVAAADRAYSNEKPENFQLPARALGYELVLDYRVDQLGIQGSYAGALLIEGAWFCPSIPKPLVNATVDFRAGRIDEQLWRERITARQPYLFRPKAAPDSEGHVRLVCPAADGAPTARCDLKPRSITDKTAGRPRIFLTDDIGANPPKVCRQQSVTFPPEVGAKHAQAFQYGTARWQASYSTLRNTIEGLNGVAKDGAHEALGDASRRRVRGVAAQSVLVALLIFATNLRKIDKFKELAVVDDSGDGAQIRPRRRLTKPLQEYAPTAAHSGDPPIPA
jgi:hypothetical protein